MGYSMWLLQTPMWRGGMVLASLKLCSQVTKEMWGQLLQEIDLMLRLLTCRYLLLRLPASPSSDGLINMLRLLAVVGPIHPSEHTPIWSQLPCMCVCLFFIPLLALVRVPGPELWVTTSVLFTYAHTFSHDITLCSNVNYKNHFIH